MRVVRSAAALTIAALGLGAGVARGMPAAAADDCTAGDWAGVVAAFQDATATETTVILCADITGTASLRLDPGEALVLDLNGHDLSVFGNDQAAVRVPAGAELTIRDTNRSPGTLAARSVSRGAGIGGDEHGATGTITIAGGVVTAAGGGAGIGSGVGGVGGTVTIAGGDVTAVGGGTSAGIGGSQGKDAGTVAIAGGVVTATGGTYGAGIGGGSGSTGGVVTITGGEVTATGTREGAGIGGGAAGSGGVVTISGGTVVARAVPDVATTVPPGIGGGIGGTPAVVAIGAPGAGAGSAVAEVTVSGGIDFDDTLQVHPNAILAIPADQGLTVPAGHTLRSAGSIHNAGTIENLGTIDNAGAITMPDATTALGGVVTGHAYRLDYPGGPSQFAYAPTVAAAGFALPAAPLGAWVDDEDRRLEEATLLSDRYGVATAGSSPVVIALTRTVASLSMSPQAGAAGDEVVIVGEGLSGATSVRFGAADRVTGTASDGGTRLRVTVPIPAPGEAGTTVPVTVTEAGVSATVAGGFSYASPPVDDASPPVPDAGEPPVLVTGRLPSARVGHDYATVLEVTGSPRPRVELADGSTLPEGLALEPDGTLAGRPTTAGAYDFTVTATNAVGTDEREYTIAVTASTTGESGGSGDSGDSGGPGATGGPDGPGGPLPAAGGPARALPALAVLLIAAGVGLVACRRRDVRHG